MFMSVEKHSRHALALRFVTYVVCCRISDAGDSLANVAFHVDHTYPHDTTCFTEGTFYNGSTGEMSESCGLSGHSFLRTYHLKTGRTVLRKQLPKQYFGEGISRIGGRLYVLTYQARQILEYDAVSLSPSGKTHPFPYGEGWGLTTDGCDLFATTGGSFVYHLRPDAQGAPQFVAKVQVLLHGKPVEMLNELEYVTPKLWVNVWRTNELLRIDPSTGMVERKINIRDLYEWGGESTPNGIAYSAALDPTFLLVTGKMWPKTFALRLSASDLCGNQKVETQACGDAPASACFVRPSGLAEAMYKDVFQVPAGFAALYIVSAAALVTSAVMVALVVRRARYSRLHDEGENLEQNGSSDTFI